MSTRPKPIEDLLTVADAYIASAKFAGNPETSASSRIFNDGKKLTALRGNDGITINRLAGAMQWLSDNWPDGATWPAGVDRPAPTVQAAE